MIEEEWHGPKQLSKLDDNKIFVWLCKITEEETVRKNEQKRSDTIVYWDCSCCSFSYDYASFRNYYDNKYF